MTFCHFQLVLSRSRKVMCGFHTQLEVFFRKSGVVVFTHIIKQILQNGIAEQNTREYEVSNNFDAICC